ncbi:hypothetical protein [Klebsiella pneumoniae]|uniref:hypothetical protein n=1 Tax=Klebsiella pneumoniae TaxID=573 RepID=UPI0021006590|nr:hypothetical protein [Klebsiella pneumoniae]
MASGVTHLPDDWDRRNEHFQFGLLQRAECSDQPVPFHSAVSRPHYLTRVGHNEKNLTTIGRMRLSIDQPFLL